MRVSKSITGKQQTRTLHDSNIKTLGGDVIEGFMARLEHRNLGLVKKTVRRPTAEVHHDIVWGSRDMMDIGCSRVRSRSRWRM